MMSEQNETSKAKLYKWNVSEAKITRKDGQNFPFVTHGKPLVTHEEFFYCSWEIIPFLLLILTSTLHRCFSPNKSKIFHIIQLVQSFPNLSEIIRIFPNWSSLMSKNKYDLENGYYDLEIN